MVQNNGIEKQEVYTNGVDVDLQRTIELFVQHSTQLSKVDKYDIIQKYLFMRDEILVLKSKWAKVIASDKFKLSMLNHLSLVEKNIRWVTDVIFLGKSSGWEFRVGDPEVHTTIHTMIFSENNKFDSILTEDVVFLIEKIVELNEEIRDKIAEISNAEVNAAYSEMNMYIFSDMLFANYIVQLKEIWQSKKDSLK